MAEQTKDAANDVGHDPKTPFLIDLPSRSRDDILDILGAQDAGLPVFHREERDGKIVLEHLERCTYPAQIVFDNRDPEGFTIGASSQAELGLLALQGQFSVGETLPAEFMAQIKTAGSWQARREPNSYQAENLDTDTQCDRATHVASRVWAGGYELAAAKDVKTSVRVNSQALGFDYSHFSAYGENAGNIQACINAPPEPGLPVVGCGEPVRVELEPLVRPEDFVYYFDASKVHGELPHNPSLTGDQIEHVGRALHEALVKRGKKLGYTVRRLSTPAPGERSCSISASTAAKHSLTCRLDAKIKAQQEAPRNEIALAATTPAVAIELMPDPSSSYRPPAGRLVVLVDVSASMLVNDPETYYTEDISRSYRYALVDQLLVALLEFDINLDVAIVSFSGPGDECIKPVLVDDDSLWALSDTSVSKARDELGQHLLNGPSCSMDGTDIAAPLAAARELLENRERGLGRDVVVLITDGAHTTKEGKGSPLAEGLALIDAGASLNLVRVQQEDHDLLRKEFVGPRHDAIIRRWAWLRRGGISEGDINYTEIKYEDWIRDLSRDNDLGLMLLEQLAGLAIESAELNLGTDRAHVLSTVHRQMLPQFGAIEALSTSRCGRPELETPPGGAPTIRMVCDMKITPGKAMMPKVAKNDCMGKIRSAILEGNGVSRRLDLLEETSTTLYFREFTFGERARHTRPLTTQLIVTADPNPDFPRCD